MKTLLIMTVICFSTIIKADLRDSARELLLNGQRGKAYELLINGMSVKNSNSKNNKLKKELSNLSDVFVSEQSQKYFQQSQTQFFSGDSAYRLKLEKAEKIEPENLKIIFAKTWLLLIEKKCSKAKSELNKMKTLNIEYDGLAIIDFYIKLCEKKTDAECGSFNYNTKSDLRKKVFKLASCRKEKEDSLKLEAYCKLLKIDLPNLPEIDLWCSPGSSGATKYKNDCASIEEAGKNRHLLEVYPFLCDKKISSHVKRD